MSHVRVMCLGSIARNIRIYSTSKYQGGPGREFSIFSLFVFDWCRFQMAARNIEGNRLVPEAVRGRDPVIGTRRAMGVLVRNRRGERVRCLPVDTEPPRAKGRPVEEKELRRKAQVDRPARVVRVTLIGGPRRRAGTLPSDKAVLTGEPIATCCSTSRGMQHVTATRSACVLLSASHHPGSREHDSHLDHGAATATSRRQPRRRRLSLRR